MGQSLTVSDFLDVGQVYTFSFNMGHSIPFGAPTSTDLAGDLTAVPYLGNVNVKSPLLSQATEITFTQSGDGSVTVAQAATDIQNAIESAHWLVSFAFVEAAVGTGGIIEKDKPVLADPFETVKTVAIWAAVIVGLLVLLEVTSTIKEVV